MPENAIKEQVPLDDAHDAAMWRKYKHLFIALSALFESFSPVLTKRIELQDAARDAAR